MEKSTFESMEYSADTSNTQYGFHDIQSLLNSQLGKARRQYPACFSKPVYALPAISDNIAYQLEQDVEKEQKDHKGKRIVLIPYSLANSVWIGILIEFEADE